MERLGSMNAAQPICDRADPLTVIEEDHALHLELCDVLECLADGLPDNADPALARVAVAFLRNGFPAHLRIEERVLSQLVERHADKAGHLLPVVEHLKAEHATDECAALDVADQLQVLAEHGRVANAEMLGYMLRGFFEAQRRHIWWERSVLLPLARQALSPEDLGELQAWIIASGRPACSHVSLAELKRIGQDGIPCERCAVRESPQDKSGNSE